MTILVTSVSLRSAIMLRLVSRRLPLAGLSIVRPCSTSSDGGTTVSIDVSKVPQRTPLPSVDGGPPQRHSGLLSSLATQMRVRGPMSIKEFMTVALTHPRHGYYMRRNEEPVHPKGR